VGWHQLAHGRHFPRRPSTWVGPPHSLVRAAARQGPIHRFSPHRRLEQENDVVLGRSLDRYRHGDRDVETGRICRTSVVDQPHDRRRRRLGSRFLSATALEAHQLPGQRLILGSLGETDTRPTHTPS
jgi:hypothetical protein